MHYLIKRKLYICEWWKIIISCIVEYNMTTVPCGIDRVKTNLYGYDTSLFIRVKTKLPNSEQSYKGKVKTHNYINRQNQSTTGKL